MVKSIDKTSSERLQLLRFPLIVCVIFIHSNVPSVTLANGAIGTARSSFIVNFIINYISVGIADTAVPFFFLLSGYFFFLDFSFSFLQYKKKLTSRFKSLVIPFLFWNCSLLLLFAVGQNIPATHTFFSGKNLPISSYKAFDYLNAIIGITTFPIAYQFWFIRDLIVISILTPILYFALRFMPKMTFAGLFILWFAAIWPVTVPSPVAFGFFYFGAFFAFNKISLFSFDHLGKPVAISYFTIIVIDTLTKNLFINRYIHCIVIILGIVTALYLSKYLIDNKRKKYLLWLSNYSFFLFAIHEPLLTIFQKLLYVLIVPSSNLMILILYLLNPALVIVVSVIIYKSLKRFMPRFLFLISGGR